MPAIHKSINKKNHGTIKKSLAQTAEDNIRHLAFDNATLANIITMGNSGKIIMANKAARKLLGYTKKELLTKSGNAIFNISESRFKRMLKQRTNAGQSMALLSVTKKNGKSIQCEITSAIFADEDGTKKSITTIEDRSKSILKQKQVDARKKKIVADNITLALKKSDSRQAENNERIRILTEKLEEERADIVRELHENVNQLLCASRMYVEIAKRQKKNNEIYLNRSSEYTLSAINEIKKITKGLMTDMITHLGLCEAIEIVARDTMEVNHIQISCTFKNFVDKSVNDKFKLIVYRVIQEHLNNILKHTKATEVGISLSQNKEFISFSISDNGAGCDTYRKQTEIEIENIRSRVTSYYGITELVSLPGKGCALTIKFPVRKELLNKKTQ